METVRALIEWFAVHDDVDDPSRPSRPLVRIGQGEYATDYTPERDDQ
jgi:hypothetical protein